MQTGTPGQGRRALIRSNSALVATLRRKARHKGMKTAIFAAARKLAVLVYHMLRRGQDNVDEGETAYEERYRQHTLAHLETTAKQFGYQLVSSPAAALTLEPASALATYGVSDQGCPRAG